MNSNIQTLLLVATNFLLACGEGGGGNKDDRSMQPHGSDLIKTEPLVTQNLFPYTLVQRYNGNGELVGETEYTYGMIPINPSFEERDGDGTLMKKVDIAVDEHGYIMQRKTEVLVGGMSILKTEDFERDEDGNATSVVVENDGQYRRTEILLSNSGKEINSQIYNVSDELLSEREIDWENNEITFYAYDSEGKPALQLNYKYLMLEMVEGVLHPVFNVSQTRDVLTNTATSSKMIGECVGDTSPIKCEQSQLGANDVVEKSIKTSFYIVPVDNGIVKSHEVRMVENDEKVFEGEKLLSEKKHKSRYGDNFQLKSELSVERIIGGAITESETIYYYDAEGRMLEVDIREHGELKSKIRYGY